MVPKVVDPLFDFVQNNITQRKKDRKREKKVRVWCWTVGLATAFYIDVN